MRAPRANDTYVICVAARYVVNGQWAFAFEIPSTGRTFVLGSTDEDAFVPNQEYELVARSPLQKERVQ